MSFMQPYLLRENLQMPVAEQGRASAILSFSYEATVFLLVATFGALSDKIGRRPIFVLGFLWLGVALGLYPLAENLLQLTLCRIFFAIGSAMLTGMMTTVLADYPQEHSRGFMVAIGGIANGLGAMTCVLLLSRLPKILADMGYTTLMSGRLTYWTGTLLCFVSAVVVSRGLKGGKPGKSLKRQRIASLLKDGIRVARANPRVMVAYLEAFVARGDLMLISTFFALWASQSGVAVGLTLEEATRKAGLFIAIIQGSSLIWAPVWGFILDRIDRLTAVAMAMGIAGIAYLWAGFSPNPIATAFIPVAVMLGIGEFSGILAGGALIGQEAPEDIRGSTVGLFNMCGSIGVIVLAVVGGLVFDYWKPGGPFVVVGFMNLLILVIAVLVRIFTGYKSPKGTDGAVP
jgi:MFS family permease